MLYNSLDRLLDGIAATLRDEIAPRLPDPYARGQAHAAAELLAHLAEHVEWRCDQLRTEIDAARALVPSHGVPPADSILDNRVLIETHDGLLRAMAYEPTAVSDDFARHYHARELERFAAARARIRAGR
jgi:hypothetical protein